MTPKGLAQEEPEPALSACVEGDRGASCPLAAGGMFSLAPPYRCRVKVVPFALSVSKLMLPPR